MNKFINYLMGFALISAIPVLLQIYVKGPEMFFGNIIQSVWTIVIYYFLACFIFNIITSTCFYVFGRFNGLTISFLNFYPLFIRNDFFCISYNILSVFKLPNTYRLNIDNIEDYRQKVDKSKKMHRIFIVTLAIMLLAIGIYYKISICYFIFAIICLHFIINDYFDSSRYFTFHKERLLVFDELVFSENIDTSVIQIHIDYLQKKEEQLLSNPDLLYDLLKVTFSCYNYNNLNYILRLDSIIEDLLSDPAESIDIACRGLIFDYIDNRVCLSVVTKESIGDIKKLLNMYISKDWDINIPQPYLNRYKILVDYLNSPNHEIRFRTGYSLLYLNKKI